MRRTRKWKFVAQEAERLIALGLGPQELAERLGVDRSTVTRWTQQGKISFPQRPDVERVVAAVKSPAEWAAAVRVEYQLDETDDQLVTMAEQALTVALGTGGVMSRLAAMGRFQTLTRQLALSGRRAGASPAQAETPEPERKQNPVVPRSGGDPRAILMAVK